jgi:hypothetical protein
LTTIGEFRKTIAELSNVVSYGEIRAEMRGIRLAHAPGGGLALVATDGHRMHIARLGIEIPDLGKGVTVRREGIQRITSLLKNSDSLPANLHCAPSERSGQVRLFIGAEEIRSDQDLFPDWINTLESAKNDAKEAGGFQLSLPRKLELLSKLSPIGKQTEVEGKSYAIVFRTATLDADELELSAQVTVAVSEDRSMRPHLLDTQYLTQAARFVAQEKPGAVQYFPPAARGYRIAGPAMIAGRQRVALVMPIAQ